MKKLSKKEQGEKIIVSKLLRQLKSDKVSYDVVKYHSGTKGYYSIQVYIDVSSSNLFSINPSAPYGQAILYEGVNLPDVRFKKSNTRKIIPELENIKMFKQPLDGLSPYQPSKVLKADEMLMVCINEKISSGQMNTVDPLKAWNRGTDRKAKLKVLTLMKDRRLPLFADVGTDAIIPDLEDTSVVDDTAIVDEQDQDEIIDDIGLDDTGVIDDDVIPDSDDEIIDDLNEELPELNELLDQVIESEKSETDSEDFSEVEDPSQADAGLTSDQEKDIKEIIAPLIESQKINLDLLYKKQAEFAVAKESKGKMKGVHGMRRNLNRYADSILVDNFNNLLNKAVDEMSGSEVELEVAKHSFNPLDAKIKLKSAFFNEKGSKRRDRLKHLETYMEFYSESVNKAIVSFSERDRDYILFHLEELKKLAQDKNTKYDQLLDQSRKIEESIEGSNDFEYLVEELRGERVMSKVKYFYRLEDKKQINFIEAHISDLLDDLVKGLQEVIGPHPVIEDFFSKKNDLREKILSGKYNWRNYRFDYFLESMGIPELNRVAKENKAIKSLENLCVKEEETFSFNEEVANNNPRYQKPIIKITSPQYAGFAIELEALPQSFERLKKKYFTNINKHFQAIFFGLEIISNYSSRKSINLHYEEGIRAHFKGYDNQIVLAPKDHQTVALHEVMHALEYWEPNVMKLVTAFLASRIDSDKQDKVKRGEWSFRDAMHSDYASKVYSDGVSEVVTMGVQEFITPVRAMQLAKTDYPHYLFSYMIVTGKMKDYL
jgi:hypothetical protein